MSFFFLKVLLEHCCSPSPTTFAGALRVVGCWGKFLTVPICAYVCSTAMVCPSALDLAGVTTLDLASVVTSGCFAAIAFFFDGCFTVVVAGLLFGRCFAAESVMATPRCRCFAVGGVFFPDGCLAVCGFLADALPPLALEAPSLVDVVLPRVCWPAS
jgi:hypothetical protein